MASRPWWRWNGTIKKWTRKYCKQPKRFTSSYTHSHFSHLQSSVNWTYDFDDTITNPLNTGKTHNISCSFLSIGASSLLFLSNSKLPFEIRTIFHSMYRIAWHVQQLVPHMLVRWNLRTFQAEKIIIFEQFKNHVNHWFQVKFSATHHTNLVAVHFIRMNGCPGRHCVCACVLY